jgi:glycosyltransferase involved in cell wall biosynthesis
VFVAYAVARLLRRPVLFTNHSYASRVKMYRRLALAKNFHTVVLTPNMLRHYGLKEAFPRVSIISDCCADRFLAEPLLERRPLPPAPPLRIAGVGNIMRWKNWHLLAEALVRLGKDERQRLEFSLWGPRPSDPDSVRYAVELCQLIAQHKLERQFRLRGLTHDIPAVLGEADWFLIPSTNEPCSVALIEAMALGLPVLATASGGNLDIVSDRRNGLLFAANDPAELAAILRLLLNEPPRLDSPEQIRESVRQRSASAVALQYRKLYEYLAPRPSGDFRVEN